MPDLFKSDLALTDVTAGVSDSDLSIVLNPSRSAEKVVDTGCHIVPFIVVSKSTSRNWKQKLDLFMGVHSICVSQPPQSLRQQRLTLVNAH